MWSVKLIKVNIECFKLSFGVNIKSFSVRKATPPVQTGSAPYHPFSPATPSPTKSSSSSEPLTPPHGHHPHPLPAQISNNPYIQTGKMVNSQFTHGHSHIGEY